MSQQNDKTLTRVTGEAIEEFRLVRQDASDLWVYADAGEVPVGCVEGYVASGYPAAAQLLHKAGTQRMVAAGPIAKYAKVYSAANGMIDDVVTGCLVGTALEAATALNDIIEVLPEINDDLAEPVSTREIWVNGERTDAYTADGSRAKPYKTLAAGWAALTVTRNQLNILPGDYTTAAVLALPAFSIYVNGIGPNGSVVIAPDAAHIVLATPMFAKAAGAVAATCYYDFNNLTIDHGNANKGITIDNTTAGKKLFLSIRNCEFGGDSANAIDVVTHGDTGNAVRVNINNGGMEIEGPINFAVGNSSDYLRASDAILSGGFVSNTQATVAEFTFRNCEILHAGITGGATQQVVNAISCHSRTGATLAVLDGDDLAGSHTENILTV